MAVRLPRREQHVVFEVDVVDEVVAQLGDARIQGAPGVAGALGGRGVVGQGVEPVQRGAVVHVLGTHHADGLAHEGVAPGLEHRKQHLFLLGHVREQFTVHAFEQVGQPGRHQGVVAVHGFHAAGHADQFGQLGAVHFMVARQDVVDERAGRGGFGQGVAALQGRQFRQDGMGVQSLLGGGMGQADLPAAAEVELEPPEHRGGAGQLHGNLADLLIRAEGRVRGVGGLQVINAGVHGDPLKIHLM
jgi:hypothetical protein